ncbi:putative 3-carboxymuconate cyclase [Catenulispora acidiphila DSM 44928]|uniref:Putative 3-carboxymuconate cyclase n=1 Tax=Catenulispora acidiphila (strain DSM 44928 / JCM 14897 / NBRC 102108 / NRRL B-24433 / ID139908) TaxID=479433 RepID=C7Q992_CATAD|nr:3-carboxymuconate cyclase [Catenulispora acidiphila]ACU74238.1 putative 3-carboxymuconate cyclase [Catenulispora acidiphila DSM 44928]
MKTKNALSIVGVVAGTFGAVAVTGPAAQAATSRAAGAARTTVYTETDAAAGNEVLAFHGDGTAAGRYATGGTGDGAGLGSQGAVTIADGGRTLFAVNAGSDSVSEFSVASSGALKLLGTYRTGTGPLSVAVHGNDVYVLGQNTVTAYWRFGSTLAQVAQRPLSAGTSGAAEVAVTPDGSALLVTEKGSSTLDVFALDYFGIPGAASGSASAGQTPFGFAFGRNGTAVVSNVGPGAGGSSASGYQVRHGALRTTTAALPDGQTAACWVTVGPDGRTAYVENAGSGTVSTYAVGSDGSLRLLDATAVSPGGHVGDATVSGGALWILDTKQGLIDDVALGADGTPHASSVVTSGIPASAAGLAAVTR